jgi:hypothetical protein
MLILKNIRLHITESWYPDVANNLLPFRLSSTDVSENFPHLQVVPILGEEMWTVAIL